jgi:hypothetical protein
MLVTDAMLQAAVTKAVEVKLLPGAGFLVVAEEDCRKVKAVIEAALAEADDVHYVMAPPLAEPFPWCRFVVMHEVPHGFDALTSKLVYREVAMLGTDDRDAAEGYAEDLANRSGRKAWVVDRIIE